MVKKKFLLLISIVVTLDLFSAQIVLASMISADEVETIVGSIGKEQTIGNILIWFLCALGFLKLSTKMESILGALGISTGNSGGGSILGAAMVAMRGIKAVSGGGRGYSNSSSSSSTASGATSPLSGGLAGVIGRKATSNAADSITGKIDSSLGETMFDKSLAEGSNFSKDIISNIAQGEIAKEGSISGERAATALSSYMGHSNSSNTSENTSLASTSIDSRSIGSDETGAVPSSENTIGSGYLNSTDSLSKFDTDAPSIGDSPFADSPLTSEVIPNTLGDLTEQPIIPNGMNGTDINLTDAETQIGSAPFADNEIAASRSDTDLDTITSPMAIDNSIPSKLEAGSENITNQSGTISTGTSQISATTKLSNNTSINSEAVSKTSASVSSSSSLSESSSNASNDMAYGGNPNISIGSSPFAENISTTAMAGNTQIPEFTDVEIGGGRITGTEITSDNPDGIKFGMYHAGQYMEPTGKHDMVDMIDGSKWYKQYAVDTVDKTPVKSENGKIEYDEKLVKQLPPVPKRKDRV